MNTKHGPVYNGKAEQHTPCSTEAWATGHASEGERLQGPGTVPAAGAVLMWKLVWTLVGWLVVVWLLVAVSRGCAEAAAEGKPSSSDSTSLAEALPFGPRPRWVVRPQNCVAPPVTSWAEAERSIRQVCGPVPVFYVGTKGVFLQIDNTKTYTACFYTKEDCEHARTTLVQEGAWTPRPSGQGGQPGAVRPIR